MALDSGDRLTWLCRDLAPLATDPAALGPALEARVQDAAFGTAE